MSIIPTVEEVEHDLISALALDILKDRQPPPDPAEGWRTITQLIEETGLTETIVRDWIKREMQTGRYETTGVHPRYYRKKGKTE